MYVLIYNLLPSLILRSSYPSISTTRTVTNITINDDGVITLNANGTLVARGNFTNNTASPTVVLGSGTVTMDRQASGTAATLTGDTEMPHLVITGSSSPQVDITSGTTISIRRSVTVESGGELGSYGGLVLLSPWDAINGECGETALVDASGTGTIAGDVTVQRCIFEDYKTYHYLSSPVNGANNTIEHQIDDDFDNTQYSTDPGHYGEYSFATPFPPAPDYFTYDETDFDHNPECFTFPYAGYEWPDPRWGWRGIEVNTHELDPGTAICARFATDNHLLDFYGPLNDINDDPIEAPLSYTDNDEEDNDGWNLIGNPYPSPIDADRFTIPTDMSNVIAVWGNDADEYEGTYSTFDCSSGAFTGNWPDVEPYEDEEGLIAIGQGFFVRALDVGVTFAFTCTTRITDNTVFFWKNEESLPDRLGLTISAGGRKDETLIVVDKTASASYDRKKDGDKLTNPRPAHNIYTLKDGAKLAINLQPLAEVTTIVPVNVALSSLENTKLIVSQFQKDEEIEYYLEDKLLGTSVLLTKDFTYVFETNTDSVSDRFFIKIVNKEGTRTDIADDQKIGAFADRKNIHVLFSDLEITSAYITVTDVMGKMVIAENVPVIGGKAVIKFEAAQTGVYVVNVKSATINSSKKIFVNQVN